MRVILHYLLCSTAFGFMDFLVKKKETFRVSGTRAEINYIDNGVKDAWASGALIKLKNSTEFMDFVMNTTNSVLYTITVVPETLAKSGLQVLPPSLGGWVPYRRMNNKLRIKYICSTNETKTFIFTLKFLFISLTSFDFEKVDIHQEKKCLGPKKDVSVKPSEESHINLNAVALLGALLSGAILAVGMFIAILSDLVFKRLEKDSDLSFSEKTSHFTSTIQSYPLLSRRPDRLPLSRQRQIDRHVAPIRKTQRLPEKQPALVQYFKRTLPQPPNTPASSRSVSFSESESQQSYCQNPYPSAASSFISLGSEHYNVSISSFQNRRFIGTRKTRMIKAPIVLCHCNSYSEYHSEDLEVTAV